MEASEARKFASSSGMTCGVVVNPYCRRDSALSTSTGGRIKVAVDVFLLIYVLGV